MFLGTQTACLSCIRTHSPLGASLTDIQTPADLWRGWYWSARQGLAGLLSPGFQGGTPGLCSGAMCYLWPVGLWAGEQVSGISESGSRVSSITNGAAVLTLGRPLLTGPTSQLMLLPGGCEDLLSSGMGSSRQTLRVVPSNGRSGDLQGIPKASSTHMLPCGCRELAGTTWVVPTTETL